MTAKQPDGRRTILRSARLLDVDDGRLISPACVLVEGDRITAVDVADSPGDTEIVDLGDLTLLPGLMDMEVNVLLGGAGSRMAAVQMDPALRTLAGVANALTTLLAGFTMVRNLGLFIQPGASCSTSP